MWCVCDVIKGTLGETLVGIYTNRFLAETEKSENEIITIATIKPI